VIRDGAADLIAVGARMRAEPDWPHVAHTQLSQRAALAD
jgi:2,4-dienoyl-CoA reductase-like NADH-dependent reductase (Old Yellow Enzyme family)